MAFSFGQASAPAGGGLFSAPASSAAAAPFSFATPAATQPGQQASLFGAQPGQQQAPSLFGGAPQPAQQQSPSLFAGGIGGGLVPFQPQQQQQQLALGAGALELSDAVRAIDGIASSYTPGNPRCRFQHLLLNVVEAPGSRVKPPAVDELQWREALQRVGGPNNPDHLWPVLAQGFKDLLARKAAQDEAIKEQEARLESLKQTAAVLASRQEALIQEQLEGVRRRHVRLCEQLLHVLRHIDALEGRFAQAMGVRSPTPRELLQQLSHQLAELEAEVTPARLAGGLHSRVEALSAAAQLQARRAPAAASGPEPLPAGAAGLESVYACLQQYADALGKLQEVVQRDVAVVEACGQV